MRARLFATAICAAFVLSGVARAIPPPPFEWHTLASAPKSEILASANGSRIDLWDPQSGKIERTLTGNTEWVNQLIFSSDGKLLASSGLARNSRDLNIRLWDVETGRARRTLSIAKHLAWLVGFSQNSQRIVTIGHDGIVELWNVNTGKVRKSFDTQDRVVSAALSPDGNTLATVSGKSPFWQVQLWDVQAGKAGRVLHMGDRKSRYEKVFFSPDGKMLAAVGERNPVVRSVLTLWDVASGKSKWNGEPMVGIPCGVTFAPDGKTLAMGGGHCVEFWDTQTGKEQGFVETRGSINSCVFSRDGKHLVVADWQSQERTWDFLVTVYEVRVIQGGVGVVLLLSAFLEKEKNERRDVQGVACLAIAQSLKNRAEALPESQAKDAEKLSKLSEELFERAARKYADVKLPTGGSVGDQTKSELYELRRLCIGMVAPEVEGEDADSKKFKLSDYRGKVVLLDFWGNW